MDRETQEPARSYEAESARIEEDSSSAFIRTMAENLSEMRAASPLPNRPPSYFEQRIREKIRTLA